MLATIHAQDRFHGVRHALQEGKGTDREWEYFGTKVFVVLAIRYQLVDPKPTDDDGPSVNVNKVAQGSPFAVMSERYPRFLRTVADTIEARFSEKDVNEVRWRVTMHSVQFTRSTRTQVGRLVNVTVLEILACKKPKSLDFLSDAAASVPKRRPEMRNAMNPSSHPRYDL